MAKCGLLPAWSSRAIVSATTSAVSQGSSSGLDVSRTVWTFNGERCHYWFMHVMDYLLYIGLDCTSVNPWLMAHSDREVAIPDVGCLRDLHSVAPRASETTQECTTSSRFRTSCLKLRVLDVLFCGMGAHNLSTWCMDDRIT